MRRHRCGRVAERGGDVIRRVQCDDVGRHPHSEDAVGEPGVDWFHEPVRTHGSRLSASERVHHLSVRGNGCVRTHCAEAAHLAIDDVGLVSALVFVPDAELRARVARETIHKDVGGRQQAPEDLPSFVSSKVERETSLVLVALQVRHALTGRQGAVHVAQVVALRWSFDLDHIGAMVAEVHPERVAVQQDRRLDDAYPLEEISHGQSTKFVPTRGPGVNVAGIRT